MTFAQLFLGFLLISGGLVMSLLAVSFYNLWQEAPLPDLSFWLLLALLLAFIGFTGGILTLYWG